MGSCREGRGGIRVMGGGSNEGSGATLARGVEEDEARGPRRRRDWGALARVGRSGGRNSHEGEERKSVKFAGRPSGRRSEPESAPDAAGPRSPAPSRVAPTSGRRRSPRPVLWPHSPGSPAAGAAGAASANSGAGCCGGCSPWSSSELMCCGFACLRLDMVRASGRRESRASSPSPPQIPGVGKFTPLRPERACPSNYYYQ